MWIVSRIRRRRGVEDEVGGWMGGSGRDLESGQRTVWGWDMDPRIFLLLSLWCKSPE